MCSSAEAELEDGMRERNSWECTGGMRNVLIRTFGVSIKQHWFSVQDQALASFWRSVFRSVLGSVSTYWQHNEFESSCLVSSFKGSLTSRRTRWLTKQRSYFETGFFFLCITRWVTYSQHIQSLIANLFLMHVQKVGVRRKYFQALAGRTPSQRVVVGRTSCFRPVVIPSSWSRTEVPPLCRN